MTILRQATQAVVDRWDQPLWKDGPATAVYIDAMRTALEAPEQEPDLYQSYIAVCEELVKRTKERDALLAAGMLALEALEHVQWKNWRADKAITELLRAGVE